jgi:TM2 domain-containing membrane protein YozV
MGPVDAAKLQGAWKRQEVPPESIVCAEGSTHWVPFHAVAELVGAPPAAVATAIRCLRCHVQISGAPEATVVTCPYCGNVNNVHAVAPMAPPMSAPMLVVPPMSAPGHVQPKCSRMAYVLLGLFLGGLGIHNFVAGRKGAGIAQLLITLVTGWLIVPLALVGVWVLIEICTVTTDGNGMRMS